jgi:hypothetical protein
MGPMGLCLVCFTPKGANSICSTCGDPGSTRMPNCKQDFLQTLREGHVCAKHRTTQAYADCSKCFLPHCADCLFLFPSKRGVSGPFCLLCFRMETVGNEARRRTFVLASEVGFRRKRRSMRRGLHGSHRIGWNWFWFAPLSLIILYFVETHTIPFGLVTLKLAFKRWTWGGLLSPSAYFCLSTVLLSVTYPVQGLLIAITSLANGAETAKKRYLQAAVALAIVAILPFITDTLIWGSFPFTFDDAGIGRLRLIPFLPWPSGGYGAL